MNATSYLLEYVRLELMRDVETGINRWAVFFHQARAAFRYDDCHLLLAGVKSFENLPEEAQAIIWHCHGGLLHQQQRWDETVNRYQYSLLAFEAAGNLLGQGQVLSDLGNVYQITGEWGRATEHYSQALSLKRSYAQPGDLAATINNLAVNQMDLGEPATALDTLVEALELYQKLDNQEGVAQVLLNRGNCLVRLGRLDEAETAYQHGIQSLEQANARWDIPSALNGLGNIYRRRGQLDAALDVYGQSLAVAQQNADMSRQEQAIGNMGLVEQAKGNFATARHYYNEALTLCEELGDETGCTIWLSNLGLLLGMQKREQEALPLFERALALARQGGNRASEGAALLNIGNIYRNSGQYALAERPYQEGVQIAHHLGDLRLEARFHSCLGTLADMQAQTENAEQSLTTALALYQRSTDAYGQVEVQLKLARLQANQSRLDEAQKMCELALVAAQEHDFYILEIRLLWLLADIYMANQDVYGLNLYAYIAVRTVQADDETRLQQVLSRLKRPLQAAMEAHADSAIADMSMRLLSVWKDERWRGETAVLIAWLAEITDASQHK